MKKSTKLVIGAGMAVAGGLLVYKNMKSSDDTTTSEKGVEEKKTSGVGYTPAQFKTVEDQVDVYRRPQLIQ